MSACQAMMHVVGDCYYIIVAESSNRLSARMIEYAYIVDYVSVYHHCPPGHWSSCK